MSDKYVFEVCSMGERDCPVCMARKFSPLTSVNGVRFDWWKRPLSRHYEYKYIACDQCGFVTMANPFSCEDYCRYYSFTAPISSYLPDFYYRRYAELKKFIIHNLDVYPKKVLLEVGGEHCAALNLFDECARLIAIEPSLAAYEYAKINYPKIEFFPMALEAVRKNAPQLANVADVAICSHVLEHVVAPDEFVRHLGALVAEGGYLYIEAPSLEARYKYIPTSHLSFIHINHFSEHTLSLLCMRFGLQPIQVVSVNLDDGYAVVRAVFRKFSPAQNFKKCFLDYAGIYERASDMAARRIVNCVQSSKKALIWGASVDLHDVLSFLPSDVVKKLVVVDSSVGKQGISIGPIKISSPEIISVIDYNEYLFFSATRTPVMHASIQDALHQYLPDAFLEPLFSYDFRTY